MRNYLLFKSCILSLLIAVTGCDKGGELGKQSKGTDKLFTARKSDLVIGLLLKGSVNAKEKYKLALEANLNTRLNWIAEENTQVKINDVIIKFDTEDLVQGIDDLKVTIDSTEKDLLIKNEEKRILESENKASIRTAKDSVTSAEEAFGRYRKYDGKKAKDGKELSVSNREKAYKDTQKSYNDKQDVISNKIYDDDASKEKDTKALADLKQTMEEAENSLKNAELDLKIFKRYTQPNKLTDLKNKLEQAQLNLEKVKISTASRMIQKDNSIFSLEKKLKKYKKDLKRAEEYLTMMEIKAPIDGILVYGDMDGRGRGKDVEIGMEVRKKQVLATIPDMNNLIVDFELPEQFRHKVNKGAKVLITPESIPSLKADGKVSEIAMVPVNQLHWDRSSPKIYRSKIELDDQPKDLVSGMNVQVEVITETLKDVVNVPVEAIFEEEGEYFVYLKGRLKTKKQVVEIGKSNDNYVHVVKGLEENDVVYLYRPFEKSSSD